MQRKQDGKKNEKAEKASVRKAMAIDTPPVKITKMEAQKLHSIKKSQLPLLKELEKNEYHF